MVGCTTSQTPSPLSILPLYQVPVSPNSEQIFPEMKLRGRNPNSCIHVSVSDLYIPTISAAGKIGAAT